jgi:hypothetical protein
LNLTFLFLSFDIQEMLTDLAGLTPMVSITEQKPDSILSEFKNMTRMTGEVAAHDYKQIALVQY